MRRKLEIFGLFFIMKTEVFKDIPNYEGIYQVSNFGKVKSLSRKIKNNKGFYDSKELFLKAGLSKRNYYSVVLRKNNKSKTFRIHILIAMAFLNHKPNREFVVDHKSNKKEENFLDNLQIISHRENCTKDRKRRVNKYAGVKKNKKLNKWVAQMQINGKEIHLGVFEIEEEASEIYKKASLNIEKFENPKQFRELLR